MIRALIGTAAVTAALTIGSATQTTGQEAPRQAPPPGQGAAQPAQPPAQGAPQPTGRGTAQPTGRGTAARPAPARTTSLRIMVHDVDRASLNGVRLQLSGADSAELETGAAGTAVVPTLKPGLYRIRAERQGFITLEREFTAGPAALTAVDIVLNAAPPPPPPPPPAKPEPAPVGAVPPGGPPVTLSIPDFLDRSFIGREPVKESILACKPFETVRLLQMREGLANHVHERVDEIIYVVAGEGAIRLGDQATPIRPGSLVVVPNGSGHGFERRGKNPLIVVSTLTGSACEPAKAP